jgi:hypothetical protein
MEHDILDALDRAEHKLGESVDAIPGGVHGGTESRKTQVAELRAEADDLVTNSDGEALKARIRGNDGSRYVRFLAKEGPSGSPRVAVDVRSVDAHSAATDGNPRAARADTQ